MWNHSPKHSLRMEINTMLESYGYVISIQSLKRFERMNKKTHNELYELLRYGMTDSDNLVNDLWLCYGLNLLED